MERRGATLWKLPMRCALFSPERLFQLSFSSATTSSIFGTARDLSLPLPPRRLACSYNDLQMPAKEICDKSRKRAKRESAREDGDAASFDGPRCLTRNFSQLAYLNGPRLSFIIIIVSCAAGNRFDCIDDRA